MRNPTITATGTLWGMDKRFSAHRWLLRALAKNIVIFHRGERRVRRDLRLFQSLLSFLMPLRSSRALR